MDGVSVWVVTSSWIQAHKTERGGWTRDQLSALGVSWPPKAGWLETVCGAVITDTARRAFEAQGVRRDNAGAP